MIKIARVASRARITRITRIAKEAKEAIGANIGIQGVPQKKLFPISLHFCSSFGLFCYTVLPLYML